MQPDPIRPQSRESGCLHDGGLTSRRAFDVVASATGLLALAPLLILIAAWVKLDSEGSAFFHQERIGLRGRAFRMHKFRTMRVLRGNAGSPITGAHDPRVTRAGRFLRRLKLDELPQLYNVFRGQMSLVGPRPEVRRYVEQYPPGQREVVLSVRPGITDLASLVYIDESQMIDLSGDPERFYVEVLVPAKLRLAEAYVRNRSWWLDLRILFATLASIVGWRWIPAPWSDQICKDL
jgi:lipopolysaccharide/colanic/teichoic acid biosynthesis glycosyltransferase